MPSLFLAVSLVGAAFTINALRPTRFRLALVPSFFGSWLTNELAIHHLVWQAVFTVGFIVAGALGEWQGWAGLGITLLSWGGLAYLISASMRAGPALEGALEEALGPDYPARIRPELAELYEDRLPWRQILRPFPMRNPDVKRTRDVEYGSVGRKRLKLDVYQHVDEPRGKPCLLQIHGGAWVVGSKRDQGIPLLLHMASKGWVCFNADYRLSPRATFPDHLVDLKQAVAWVREHAHEYGGDPDFLVVTGGSAGGHLSSLVALTANEPEYQPGFEDVDTSVQACVPFYGVYDFTNRTGHGVKGMDLFLARMVMKSRLRDARDEWEKASPMSRVHGEAPPFFVIHGNRDVLTPVREARHFVELLRESSGACVVYAELPGAQHAFEIFPSIRTAFTVKAVERFLGVMYSEHLDQRERAAQAS